MIKGRIAKGYSNPRKYIKMRKLKVGQLAVVRKGSSYIGNIVVRSPSRCKFEVLDLTDLASPGWSRNDAAGIKVEILPQNEKVVLELWND